MFRSTLHAPSLPAWLCAPARSAAHTTYHIAAAVALIVALSGCVTVEVPALTSLRDLDYGPGESFVKVGDDEVCLVDRGRRDAAETLVFLHPWGGNIGWWRDVVPRFSDDFRVVIIDLPGHGKSSMARGEYDIPRAEAAVIGVMDQLGIGSATLIGNSMGGGVALALTHDHPDRVERLVLVDALGSGDVPGVFGFFADQFFEAPLFLGVDDGLVQLGIELFAFDSMGAASEALAGEIIAARRSEEGYAWALAVSSYLRNIIGFTGQAWLEGIKAPTLIVWGDSDWILWPWSADTFHEGIEGSRLVVLEDCGHMPELEQPDALAEAIADFLAQTPRATTAAIR